MGWWQAGAALAVIGAALALGLLALPWLFGGTELPLLGRAAAGAAELRRPCLPSSARIGPNQPAKGDPVSMVLDDLERLSKGLLFPSESDYPLELFAWRSAQPFSPEALIRECGYPEDTPVEVAELDYFFRNVIQEQDWHGPEEQQTVKRFRKLHAYLKDELRDAKVYRLGTINIDAYILGRTADGHVVGLKTTLVET